MKKFKVTLANNEILHVYRKWYDTFLDGWEDWGKFRSFRLIQGDKKVRITVRWIIKIEEE